MNGFCKPAKQPGHEVTYAAPEFNDILDVVNSAIQQHHLTIVSKEVQTMGKFRNSILSINGSNDKLLISAVDLFKYTLKMYKKRRGRDLQIAIPLASSNLPADPAETDAELRRKLEENMQLRRKEEDVSLIL